MAVADVSAEFSGLLSLDVRLKNGLKFISLLAICSMICESAATTSWGSSTRIGANFFNRQCYLRTIHRTLASVIWWQQSLGKFKGVSPFGRFSFDLFHQQEHVYLNGTRLKISPNFGKFVSRGSMNFINCCSFGIPKAPEHFPTIFT